MQERFLEKIQEPNHVSDGRPREDAQKRNGNREQKFLTLQKVKRNEKNRIGKCVRLEYFVTAVFKNEVIKEKAPEDNGRSRLFPSVMLYKLKKENQLNR